MPVTGLPGCCPVVPLLISKAPVELNVESRVAVNVVNAPVFAVVAPTVPLMFMDAVPVRLVTVPDDGVPSAPPFTKGEPTVPTFTAKAVATPVPRPDMPVEIGNPVPFVKVTLVGVPSTGVTKVGLVDKTLLPEPVEVVTPVPPLVTAKVPAKETAPVVAVDGVKPVVPALNDVTPPVDADHVAVDPLEVNT